MTSIGSGRRACYQVFLLSHVAGWITFVVALASHVPEFARPHLIGALALYVLDVCTPGRVRVTSQELTHLTQPGSAGSGTRAQDPPRRCDPLCSPRRHDPRREHHPGRGLACGTARLAPDVGWRGLEPQLGDAPFYGGEGAGGGELLGAAATVSTALSDRQSFRSQRELIRSRSAGRLTLLVKSTGRFTRGLLENSGPLYDYRQCVTVPCAIEGPYGGLRFLDLAELEAVVLVAGGSGITTCLPLVEKLLYLAKQGEATTRVVSLVWTVRTVEEIEWCREVLAELIGVARDETELTLRVSLHGKDSSLAAPRYLC